MYFLSPLKDLAARNVLVGENMSCKVSDFGLSRELSEANQGLAVYQTQVDIVVYQSNKNMLFFVPTLNLTVNSL